jgi:hypothetical protein
MALEEPVRDWLEDAGFEQTKGSGRAATRSRIMTGG